MDKRECRFDFLRAIAILMVILAHMGIPMESYSEANNWGNWTSLFFRPAIAIFIFLSGALYRFNQEFNYLKKKLLRTIVPYITFTFVAFIYYYFNGELQNKSIVKIIGRVLVCDFVSIHYFVFLISLCYILAFLIDKKWGFQKQLWKIMTISGLLALLSGEFLNGVILKLGFGEQALRTIDYRNVFFWFVIFTFGSVYKAEGLQKYFEQNRAIFRLIYIILFGTLNILYLLNVGDLNPISSLAVILLSFAMLGFMLTFNPDYKIFKFLSDKSYTIYLSHVFFLFLIRDLQSYLHFRLDLFIGIAITFTATLFGGIAVSLIGEKILGKKSSIFIGS